MKTIVINPKDRTITEAEYNGDFKEIYTLLSFEDFGVDTFTAVRIDESETIFVDDNGLINDNGNYNGFFYVKGDYPVMLAGKGVILATDAEGESIGTKLTLDQVKNMILFGHPVLNHLTGQAAFQDTDNVLHMLDQ